MKQELLNKLNSMQEMLNSIKAMLEEPKKEAVVEAKAETAQATPVEPKPNVTLDQLRSYLAQHVAGNAENKALVQGLLKRFAVKKISELEPKYYEACLQEAQKCLIPF